MQEEKNHEAQLEELAPLGQCVIDHDGQTSTFNCITEAECHEKVQDLQGTFISWDFDPDCN
jgi:hypothetical protein